MVTQVVEITEDGHYLSKYRGFMLVKKSETEAGRIPLDDITILILSAHQITLSKGLMVELAERKTPIMTCGKNYHPLSFTLPYDSHFDQAGILWAQIDCSQPLAKRIWKSIVFEKIMNQQRVLEYFEKDSPVVGDLKILAKRLKSGDPENMEAQAARLYWRALFGNDFRRDRRTGIENALLNYGYSILRAAMARAICGAGLTAALGIHHHNRKNPFALVDDFMEIYRPLMDMEIRKIIESTELKEELTPEIKRKLTKVLDNDVHLIKGVSTVMNSMHRLAQTFVSSLHAKENHLEFPTLIQAGKLF